MKRKTEFLGTQPILSLLWKQSFPAMIGMVVMALYNFVDTVFIGKIEGTLGIAAISISFPAQGIFFALALMLGIGSASEISRKIGANQKKEAEKTLGTSFFLLTCTAFLVLFLGLLFIKPILIFSGAKTDVFPFAYDYLQIILLGSPFLIFSAGLNNIVRAEGNAKLAMIVMSFGAGMNVLLDWFFLFPLGMGISGAAWATSISQVCSASLLIPYFLKEKSAVKLKFENFRWRSKIVWSVFKIGASSFTRQIAFVFETIVFNHILFTLGGNLSIAVMGILIRLNMLILMPAFGIVQGFQPIAGFNFGAKKYKRVREVFYLSVKWCSFFTFLGGLILYLGAHWWAKIFADDPALIDMTVTAIKISVIAYFVIGFQLVVGGLYQSLGFGTQSLILSLLRQVLFLIPLAFFFSRLWGLTGIWVAFPIADVLSSMTAFFMVWRNQKNLGLIEEKENLIFNKK